jgi:hypothetical protein
MEPTKKRIFAISLWAIGAILAGLIVVSWFIAYPRWLDQILTNIMLIGLGIVMLYKAFQIRNKDPKFAAIYLIIGVVLIAVVFISFAFIKIIAAVGLVIFLLTNPRVRKILNKTEENQNP